MPLSYSELVGGRRRKRTRKASRRRRGTRSQSRRR